MGRNRNNPLVGQRTDKYPHGNRPCVYIDREDRQRMPRISLPSGPSGKTFIRIATLGIETHEGAAKRRIGGRDFRISSRDKQLAHARLVGDKRFRVKLVKANSSGSTQ